MAEVNMRLPLLPLRKKVFCPASVSSSVRAVPPGEFDWLERASEQQLIDFIESGTAPVDAGKLN
jgi:hypothetical protein